METKYIIYKNFNKKKKLIDKKRFTKFLNLKYLFNKYPLLKSLTNDYNYSFKKKKFKLF